VERKFEPYVLSVLSGLKTLVFPELCIMCRQEFAEICSFCLSRWQKPAEQLRFAVAPTYSVIPYCEEVSSIVLLAKEERNKVAQKLIAQALLRSITELLKRSATESCLLIPIPSSRQAERKRGQSFLHPILNKVIESQEASPELSDQEWSWRELLRHKRRVRDQAGLSSAARAKNMDSVFDVIPHYRSQSSRSTSGSTSGLTGGLRGKLFDLPLVVVDDVITTGATLNNAIEALRERKMTVLGAATACASAHQFLIR